MRNTNEQVKHPNPTLLPASFYGLKSDELWAARGGDEALVRFMLLRYSSDIVMKFVNGDLFSEDTVRSFSNDEVRSFNSVQPYVVEEVVVGYSSGTMVASDLPSVFKWAGKLFIFQGTHRISAALLNGTGVNAFFVDCDLLG